MPQHLQITSSPDGPAPQTPAQALLIARLTNSLSHNRSEGRSSISSALAPTDRERPSLQVRILELRTGLAPLQGRHADLDIAEHILRMFHGWPSVRLDDIKAMGVGETYVDQVRHLPMWAIVRGVKRAKGKNEPFPPSAGQLRAVCEVEVQLLRNELAAIAKILDADVYERTVHGAAAIARVRSLAASFRGGVDKVEISAKREARHEWVAQRQLEREAADSSELSRPTRLSDAARRAAGLAPCDGKTGNETQDKSRDTSVKVSQA